MDNNKNTNIELNWSIDDKLNNGFSDDDSSS